MPRPSSFAVLLEALMAVRRLRADRGAGWTGITWATWVRRTARGIQRTAAWTPRRAVRWPRYRLSGNASVVVLNVFTSKASFGSSADQRGRT
jgi:hypothetical protein